MGKISCIKGKIIISGLLLVFLLPIVQSMNLTCLNCENIQYPTRENPQKLMKNQISIRNKINAITASYTEIGPISINGNANFLSTASLNNWTGIGSVLDPIVIEGYNITGTGTENLIEITNTDLYFTINQSLLVGGNRGILLQNTTNGKLTNLDIVNNTYFGIHLNSSSQNNVLTNITIYNNGNGILIQSSSNNNTLANNTMYNNNMGFYLQSSIDNTLSNNTVFNNTQYGFFLQSSSTNNILGHNTVYNNDYGFYFVSSSNNNTLTNNDAYNNINSGFFLTGVQNNTFSNNMGYNNSGSGIRVTSFSHKNSFYKNKMFSNLGSGVTIDGSTLDCIFSDNAVYNNGGHGFLIQGTANNTFSNNTVHASGVDGFHIQSSSGNTFSDNTVYNNSNGDGISLSVSSGNNSFINNVLFNNTREIFLTSSSNNTFLNNTLNHGLGGFAIQLVASNSNIFSLNVINGTTSNLPIIDLLNFVNGTQFAITDLINFNITNGNQSLFYRWNDGPIQSILNASWEILAPSLGINFLNIWVFDSSQNMVKLLFYFDILPETDIPDLDSPADYAYYEGSTGNSIIWIAGDQFPNIYNVTKNGSLFIPNTVWINGSIIVNIDGLPKGVYSFIISVYDVYENVAQNEVIITVNKLPQAVIILSSPADLYYSSNDPANKVTWTTTYINSTGGTWTFYVNGIFKETGSIINNSINSFDIAALDLEPGIYNLTIKLEVNDLINNPLFAKDTVFAYIAKTKAIPTGTTIIKLGGSAGATISIHVDSPRDITINPNTEPSEESKEAYQKLIKTSGVVGSGYFLNIEVSDSTGQINMWINISYAEWDLAALDLNENNLNIFFYNTTTKLWEPAGNTGVDTINKIVYSNVDHLTEYTVVSFPPREFISSNSSSSLPNSEETPGFAVLAVILMIVGATMAKRLKKAK